MADQTAADASGRVPAGQRPASTSSSSARPKGGTGGKRYVRTSAGAARYGKPVGTEIVAKPRDARGAKAQTDKESTDRFKSLVSGDSKTQAQAMRGLNDDQLQRLSEVAFSFRSNDQNVVRLRAGVAAELTRRGQSVNDHGGLGGRGSGGGPAASSGSGIDVINFQTGERTHVATKGETAAAKKNASVSAKNQRAAEAAAKKAKAAADTAAKKKQHEAEAAARKAEAEKARIQRQADALERIRATNQASQARASASGRNARVIRLSNQNGRGPIQTVSDLRRAMQVLELANADAQPRMAKYLTRVAEALGASHMLTDRVRSLAGVPIELSAMVAPQVHVIELAGKWMHGWIPLDPAAVSAKTHGRGSKAKPWWSGGADAGSLSSHKRKQLAHRDRHTPDELKGGSDREYLRNLRKHTPDFMKPQAQNKRQARGPLPAPTTAKAGPQKSLERKRGPVTAESYSKSAPSSLPGSGGTEWRKNSSGSYDRFINGKKSNHVIDQGVSRREIAGHNRSISFSKSGASMSAGERETYDRNARSSRGQLSVQKSVDRNRRKQTGERVAKPGTVPRHSVERGLDVGNLESASNLRPKEFKPGTQVTAEGYTWRIDKTSRRKGAPNGQAVYHGTLVGVPEHDKRTAVGSTRVWSGESTYKRVRG